MTGKRQVQVDRIGKTGIIRLDRPDVLNAYTPDMGDELVDAFRTLASDSEVCAIVLTGKGRAFCVGADRNFLNGEKGQNGLRLGEEDFIGGFATELLTIAKPTIAAVNGKAVGWSGAGAAGNQHLWVNGGAGGGETSEVRRMG